MTDPAAPAPAAKPPPPAGKEDKGVAIGKVVVVLIAIFALVSTSMLTGLGNEISNLLSSIGRGIGSFFHSILRVFSDTFTEISINQTIIMTIVVGCLVYSYIKGLKK